MTERKVGRPREDGRRAINFYLTEELAQRIHEINRDTRVPKSQLYEQGVRLLIAHYDESGMIKFDTKPVGG